MDPFRRAQKQVNNNVESQLEINHPSPQNRQRDLCLATTRADDIWV